MSARTNRRATTDGRPIRDNSLFQIRTLVYGYGRDQALVYYRRRRQGGLPITGLVARIVEPQSTLDGESPRAVACAVCGAPIGAPCIEPMKEGPEIVSWHHDERKADALRI